jgi:hypothetical protein
MIEAYKEFLKKKERYVRPVGIGIPLERLHKALKPFQRFSTAIALNKGRFALFEDCGLGKTFQQLVWANEITSQTNQPVLILAPLAVVGQTIEEGVKFGIKVYEYKEPVGVLGGIYIANYEQLENIDVSVFSGVVLDESSILKNFEGAYRNLIIELFKNTPYRLCCSATPSPNDPMELGNHAEFLGVMSRTEMLATYFVHDGGETSKWRIKGHAEESFWKWVNTWCLMFSRPSDIGFDDEGYILPELIFHEKRIETAPRAEGGLFNTIAVSSTTFHKELKLTIVERLDEVVNLVNNSDESFIVWIALDDEGRYLKNKLKGCVEVTGSDKPEIKKKNLLAFSKDEFRVLLTKPKIAAYGLNYQNCHNMVFASPDFSFEKLYQAIRRELRYGQEHSVHVYLMTTDTMQNVMQAIKRKEQQQIFMQKQLSKYTKIIYADFYQKRAA